MSELVKALVKAKLTNPIKNKTANVGQFKYEYVDLAEILDKTREQLSQNGLVISQALALSTTGQGPTLVTRLLHISGESLTSEVELPKAHKPQEFGSIMTYYRRYALCAILGIAADEDTDANGPEVQVTPKTTTKTPATPKAEPLKPKVEQGSSVHTYPPLGFEDKSKVKAFDAVIAFEALKQKALGLGKTEASFMELVRSKFKGRVVKDLTPFEIESIDRMLATHKDDVK